MKNRGYSRIRQLDNFKIHVAELLKEKRKPKKWAEREHKRMMDGQMEKF